MPFPLSSLRFCINFGSQSLVQEIVPVECVEEIVWHPQNTMATHRLQCESVVTSHQLDPNIAPDPPGMDVEIIHTFFVYL